MLVQDLDSDHGMIRIIDPPRQTKLSLDTFKLSYSGKMLILSKAPIVIGRDPSGEPPPHSGLLGSALGALLCVYAWRRRGGKRGLVRDVALAVSGLAFFRWPGANQAHPVVKRCRRSRAASHRCARAFVRELGESAGREG